MLRVLLALLSAMTFLLAPSDASACTCGLPMGAVFPNNSHPAPTNSRVYIFVSGWGDTSPGRLRAALYEASSGKKIPSKVEVRAPGRQRYIVLTPTRELAPKTKYVVKWSDTKELSISEEFFTGASPDREPPSWNGIQAGTFRKNKGECCDCSTSDPYLELRLDNSKDETEFRTHDVTRDISDRIVIPKVENKKEYTRKYLESLFPPAQLLAVWVVESDQAIDYNTPPSYYQTTTAARYQTNTNAYLDIGQSSTCATPSHRFPDDVKKVRVGIRPVDLAGNMGVASEALFEAKPGAAAIIAPMKAQEPPASK